MAGDWIKIENVLPDKPEVQIMASILKLDPDTVVGKLCRVWIWANQQLLNGDAVRVTETFIDRITNCTGFASALRQAGWLGGEDLNLTFPGFDRHNGQTAKARALTRNRMQRSRDAGSVTTPSPEKRREEYKNTHTPPTLDHVLGFAKSNEILKEDAESFWRHFQSQGWVTSSGIPISSWIPKLQQWHLDNVRKRLKPVSGQKANGSSPSINSTFQADSVIEELIKKISSLCKKERNYVGMQDGAAVWETNKEVTAEIKVLQARLKEVRNLKLGLAPA